MPALMEFLKRKVIGKEMLKLARAAFEEFIHKDKPKEKLQKR